MYFFFFLVLVITVTEVNVPSVTCRVKHVRDPEEISALLVREAGKWQPANAIPSVQKGSLSQTSVVRNVIIIAARAKVSYIAVDWLKNFAFLTSMGKHLFQAKVR